MLNRDQFERVAWTGVQAGSGALLDVLISGGVTWRAAAYAVGIAVLKVIVAHSVGDRETASIP